ncbi:MAG TPA: tetratricopeptide repeat protein [Pyrinomonadaceae bacterium]|jgi:tetratricopeptide (TPR) repeat protein
MAWRTPGTSGARLLARIFLLCLALTAYAFSASAQQQAIDARLERAQEFIRQQQLARAEAELDAILRDAPHEANALKLLGVIRAQQQRMVEAEQLFLRAIKESPAMVGAYFNLSLLYLEQHKTDRALWALTEASKLAPDEPDINYNLAAIYEERREYERALDYLAKIPRPAQSVEYLYLSIKCYLSLGRKSEALALAAPLKRRGALNPDEAAGFASVFIQNNLPDAAIEILEAARSQSADSYALLYQLGAGYARKEEWLRAEEFYTSALALKPDDVPTLRELARVARARGELEKALAHLLRARKLAPENQAVLYDFGLTTMQMDLILDALPAFERLQRLKPDEPTYLYMLALARFRHDEKAEAEALIRRYIELRPNDPTGYYILGAALNSTKRYAEARKVLEQSLALGPSADVEYQLGLISDTEGDTEGAIRWFERALKSDPAHAWAHTALGTIYFKQNKYELARAELERAVQLNDKSLRAHYQLGLVYAKLGDKERAQKMLDIADRLRAEQRTQETVGFKLIDPPQ